MICYKDKTFCHFWKECQDGATCSRALTDKVREQAVIWWGDQDVPICQYMNEPGCFNSFEEWEGGFNHGKV